MLRALIFLVTLGARALRAMCRRRADLVIENLALRQQVTALKKDRPRPPLEDVDRAFWVALRESWPAWASRLVIVKAGTVAGWNRARFRRYWTRISSTRNPGRPRLAADIRRLIRQMVQDGWGAPRIHAELTKLGFIVSEVTVSRYIPRRPAEPDQVKRWVASCATTRTTSPRWICSRCRPRRFGCCTASSSSSTAVGISFTSTRHFTRLPLGSSSSCVKLFPTTPRRDISSLTTTRSSAPRPCGSSSRWVQSQCVRPFAAPPLAEWNRRTLDRKLPARAPRARRGLRRAPFGPACEVVHQLLPQGSLPLGTRKRYAGRETDHAATVTHGQGRGVTRSGWPSPSLRVAGSCVGPWQKLK